MQLASIDVFTPLEFYPFNVDLLKMIMEKYMLPADLILFGRAVETFPEGIKEAFDTLYDNLGDKRSYYGVSWFDAEGNIKYYAMTPEMFVDESKDYHYEILTVQQGEYL